MASRSITTWWKTPAGKHEDDRADERRRRECAGSGPWYSVPEPVGMTTVSSWSAWACTASGRSPRSHFASGTRRIATLSSTGVEAEDGVSAVRAGQRHRPAVALVARSRAVRGAVGGS